MTKSKISMIQRRVFLLFLLIFSKKVSRFGFFLHIKYVQKKSLLVDDNTRK